MSIASVLRTAGNKLYEHAFPIYRPLYAAYKACLDYPERRLLRKVLFPGAVAVDAGANIGIYSQFLSHCVGPTGVVHSFEPSPDNFKLLTTATRRLSNVRLTQAAVGMHSGNSELYISRTLNVDHRTYPVTDASRLVIRIKMIALDDYFEPDERVDLIKLDIQGYELQALRGAKRVLMDNPEIKLLLELWPYGMQQAGASCEELVEMLRELSMELMLVSSRGLIPFDSRDARKDISWYVNLFASRRLG